MSQQIVISAFDYSGNMVRPWADAGYLCYCIDIQHPKGERREGNIVWVGADIMRWLPPRGDIAATFWFVPCTDTAVSGARWFPHKGVSSLEYACSMWRRSLEIAWMIGAPYMLENPVTVIGSYEPATFKFDPCDYGGYLPDGGDRYTKKTLLWTGHGFIMPPKRRVDPTEGSRMHLLPPSPERANLRSETPKGFAQAVFEANTIKHAFNAA